MQFTCLYHPVYEMIVTDDEEQFNKLIASGQWFESHLDAKKKREEHEKRINGKLGLHDEKRERVSHSK